MNPKEEAETSDGASDIFMGCEVILQRNQHQIIIDVWNQQNGLMLSIAMTTIIKIVK